jgi:UDP:flavonoid glycosyltransferase YjiC (YdhE family)
VPDRVLFITSNGTGLGHLTRSMAVARRLEPGLEPLIVTLSGAAPVVAEQGFEVEYISSYANPTAGSDWRWSRRLRSRMRAILREADAKVMVFDGAHPYQGLIDALGAAPETHRVWCRRPMWRPGANPGAIERERLFDHVLEPGEFAAAEDRGATVARQNRAHVVDPIVFCEDSELLPRDQAERELGIEPGAVSVIVQLGQGAEVRAASARCLRHLAGKPGVRVAALSSQLAALPDIPEGVVHLSSHYPMSRYLRAFDLCVSAAGYNAFHELIRFEVPTLFVPMPRQTDDQAARARFVQRTGTGRGVQGPGSPEIEARLDELLEPSGREAARAKLAEMRPGNGAVDAAAWIADLAATKRVRKPGTPRWKRYARHPLAEGRKAAPFAARVPAAAARVAKQTIERPSARALVLALGEEGADLEHRLPGLIERSGGKPERVLVVSDQPAVLRALRAIGTGAEQIPAAGSAQAALSGQGFEEFAASRLALILSERPKVRRFYAVGAQARDLLASSGFSTAD